MVFIIALLASIIVVNLNYARKKGRDTERISDLTTVASALNNYYLDNQGYPDPPGAHGGKFSPLVNILLTGNYLEKSIANPYPAGFTLNSYRYDLDTAPDPDVYHLWFEPEIPQNSSCDNRYLIENGKVIHDC